MYYDDLQNQRELNEKIWLDNVFKYVSKNDQPTINSVFYAGCDKHMFSSPSFADQEDFIATYEVIDSATNPEYKDPHNPIATEDKIYLESDWIQSSNGAWQPIINSIQKHEDIDPFQYIESVYSHLRLCKTDTIHTHTSPTQNELLVQIMVKEENNWTLVQI